MTTLFRIAVFGSILLSLIAWPKLGSAATEYKYAHGAPADDPYQTGANRFAELISAYTNGAYKINVFAGGQFGGEREMIEGVKLNTIEIVMTTSAPIANFEPRMMLFDLPFLFRDSGHAHRVLDGPIGQKMGAILEPHGIKVLAWMESGFRHIITRRKKITSPEDMRGMKFRVMENPVYMSMFKNLGASAVPIPGPEIYTSLQTGVVDGYEHPVGAYMAVKAHEVAKLVAMTGHTYTPVPVLMNLKLYEQLSPANKEAFVKAAKEAAVVERTYIAKTLEDFKAKLRADSKVEFYEVDKRLFQQKMAPVYKEFEGKVGKDMIEAVLAAQ